MHLVYVKDPMRRIDFSEVCPELLEQHLSWIEENLKEGSVDISLFSFLQVRFAERLLTPRNAFTPTWKCGTIRRF